MNKTPLVRHGKQARSSGARNAATARHSNFLALRAPGDRDGLWPTRPLQTAADHQATLGGGWSAVGLVSSANGPQVSGGGLVRVEPELREDSMAGDTSKDPSAEASEPPPGASPPSLPHLLRHQAPWTAYVTFYKTQ